MRGFIAALVGASIGFGQFLYAGVADALQGASVPQTDVAAYLYFGTWIATFFALVIIGMYRFSPWVARLLGDTWEAERIERDKKRHISLLEWSAAGALVIRSLVASVDAGRITMGSMVVVGFAAVPFLIPRPRPKSPARRRLH